MNTLRDNYQEHPAFFSDNEWVLPSNALLVEFAELYALLSKRGNFLSSDDFRAFESRLLVLVNKIFASLKEQAEGDEVYFVEELEKEVLKLWSDERVYFLAKKKFIKKSKALDVGNNLGALLQQRHFFGALSNECLESILSVAEPLLGQFRKNAEKGLLKREDLSINSGKDISTIVALLNAEFSRNGVLNEVSAYIEREVVVGGVALEMSVSSSTWWKNKIDILGSAPKTMYAHLDESIGFPKSIIYLSDVGPKNGPTSCYPGIYEGMQLHPLQEMIGRIVGNVGSHKESPLYNKYGKAYHQCMNSDLFRKHFMKLPESLRFNSHFGWDVLPESNLEKIMVDEEVVMTGSKGTYLIFDGSRLVHRGGLIEEGERVVMQVIFTPKLSLCERIKNKVNRVLK